VPFRAPIRAGSPKGGRATKEKEIATYNGCPMGHPYACPHRGHALMGWVPYPAHMGPHFVGPITPFGLQNNKRCEITIKPCAHASNTK